MSEAWNGDRHFVDKRAEANLSGDLVVGALKICEVPVVYAYLQTWLWTLNIQESKFVFVYTSHIHNKTSL